MNNEILIAFLAVMVILTIVFMIILFGMLVMSMDTVHESMGYIRGLSESYK